MANCQEILMKNPSSISPNNNVEVVMVPFPAQSHLNQYLQFSHIISSYNNIKVHYVASALHISQVASRATTTNRNPKKNLDIRFHGFPTPEFPSPPPHNPGFPSHLIPCFRSSVELRDPVKSLMTTLSESSKRVVIIHDPLMSYVVQDAASLPNVEAYVYYCISAISHFAILRDSLGLKIKEEEIPSSEGTMDTDLQGFIDSQITALNANEKAGIIYNTCRAIDGEFLDLISEIERENYGAGVGLWALGPLETLTVFKNRPRNGTSRHGCLEWLDKQDPRSVLYVSFGTTTFMEDDQIEELAKGLEQSGTKFIWVLRDADKGNVFDITEVRRPKLPLGFEERVEGMGIGMIVREWAPQLKILGHPSTGGFMSHCGWNSCLESLSLGVPLAAWPMHSDQPTNALLVTQELGAGLVVREWKSRDELVSSSMISEVVKRLMSSDEGKEIRKKAEDLGVELRKCMEKGGVSRLELDSFVARITRA